MTVESKEHKLKLVYRELDGFGQFESQRFHSAEGPKHYLLKHYTAYLINQAGREVGLEVQTDDGEIDILDLGESDEGALAIEVETAYSPQKVEEKREQYTSELIRDVIVLPAREAPTEFDELEAWIRDRIPV